MKRFAVLLSLAILAAGPVAAAPTAVVQSVVVSQDVDVRDFIEEVARLTDMTFIVDQRVQGTVSATPFGPASRDEILDIFVATLRANGVDAVPSIGGAYRIVPAKEQVRRTSARNERGGARVARL